MDLKRQASAPLYEAIEKFRKKRIVPFDVPGHKRGRGNSELVDLLGERCVGIDVNSMKPLDNLCHPGIFKHGNQCQTWDCTGGNGRTGRKNHQRTPKGGGCAG